MSRTLGAVALMSLFGASVASADSLNLLVWEGYADKSFVEPFEKEWGCKVNPVYVGTNDEIVSKLMAGAARSHFAVKRHDDAVSSTLGSCPRSMRAKCPTWRTSFPNVKRPAWDLKDGKLYGVPYGWGVIRIIADPAFVGTAKTDTLGFLGTQSMRASFACGTISRLSTPRRAISGSRTPTISATISLSK